MHFYVCEVFGTLLYIKSDALNVKQLLIRRFDSCMNSRILDMYVSHVVRPPCCVATMRRVCQPPSHVVWPPCAAFANHHHMLCGHHARPRLPTTITCCVATMRGRVCQPPSAAFRKNIRTLRLLRDSNRSTACCIVIRGRLVEFGCLMFCTSMQSTRTLEAEQLLGFLYVALRCWN